MGIGRALHLSVEHAGHDDIVHILSLSGDLFDRVYALQAFAYRPHAGSPPPFAARSMASTMRA